MEQSWWHEHDEERFAEVLFVVYAGDTACLRSLDDALFRDNSHLDFAFPERGGLWMEVDMRYVRYSCEHGEIGERLRRIKAEHRQGRGCLRYVDVDEITRRAREGRRHGRAGEAAGSRPLASLTSHPLSELLH